MKFLIYFFGVLAFISNIYATNYEYKGLCKENKNDFEKCLMNELNKYDRELNVLYHNENPDKKLKKIEQAWIKYKEADCDYMALEVHEGKYYQFVHTACLINKTKTRIEELKRSYFYSGWFEKKN